MHERSKTIISLSDCCLCSKISDSLQHHFIKFDKLCDNACLISSLAFELLDILAGGDELASLCPPVERLRIPGLTSWVPPASVVSLFCNQETQNFQRILRTPATPLLQYSIKEFRSSANIEPARRPAWLRVIRT